MASVSLLCPVNVAHFTREGSFSAAQERLLQLCALGADAVVIGEFDDRAGTSEELSCLCRRAQLLGLSVLLDVRCLYGGVSSPAPLIDTAVRQGVCDGFLLTDAEWRFPDVREVVARVGKELPASCFVLLGVPPEAGERPDGALRSAPTPDALIEPLAEPAPFLSCYTGVRHSLVTPVADAHPDARRADLTLLLAHLLPGVPLIPTDSYVTLPVQPTDAECAAQRRRLALWQSVRVLRREHPGLALTRGTALMLQDGVLTLTRRLTTGTLTLVLSRGEDAPLTERTVQSTPPLLSYGMYRDRNGLRLLPYGYALTYLPKVQKPPKPKKTDSFANNNSQNTEKTAPISVDADEVSYGKEEG